MTQIFWIEGRGPTTNKFYAGMHFSQRQKLADEWHLLTREAVQRYLIEEVVGVYPVVLEFKFFFKSHAQDATNTATTAKMIEDGLVKAGVLRNDSWKDVSKITLESRKGDKNTIQVKIHSL